MDPVLQPNGKYLVTSDPRRGEINLVFELPSTLRFEWKDRRTRTVVDSFTIIPEDHCTFSPAATGREGDRVNLLQFGSDPDRRFFYWMQSDPTNHVDDENVRKTQTYLTDLNECVLAAGGEPTRDGDGDAASSGVEVSASGDADADDGTTAVNNGADAGNQQQVDTLSNILSNLGMPQPSSSSSNPSSSSSAATPAPAGGTLTLADLQGAMAGLATHSPPPVAVANSTPPLHELTTSDAIDESGILDDPAAVARLTALLPEGQRTEESLRENLRSPQVQQALQALTSALVGDGVAASSEFPSVVANFSMDAADGAAALREGNPIQAFLDCLLRKVEREKKEKESATEEKEEKEDTKDDGKDDDNVPMTE